MENLVFSFNVVMPVFVVIGIGFFLRQIRLLNETFVNTAVKFNFLVGLPVLLFKSIYTADFEEVADPKLFLFVLCGIILVVLTLSLIVPRFVADRKKASALIHTMYRSNFLLLGFPLAVNMFGEENVATVSFLIPIAVPVFNLIAVILLASFDDSVRQSQRKRYLSTILIILKNPLILASAAAILFKLLRIDLPIFLDSSVSSVAALGTPLALITLGAQLDLKNVAANLRYSLAATFGRLVLVPLAVVSVAILFGFRGYALGGIFILFSSPSAVSCFVMAKEMNSDCALTADIIVLSTFFSMVTMFTGIYLLKTFALI